MPKPTTKPPLYRLTLTRAAFWAAMERNKPLFQSFLVFERRDDRLDVGITYALLDQLQTAALPKENLSDTLLRLYPTK